MSALLTVIGVWGATVVYTTSFKDQKKGNERKDEAFQLMKKAFEQKTLSPNAVRLIYDQYYYGGLSGVSYKVFLEEFIIYIRKEDQDGAMTRVIEELIFPILNHEMEAKPYSDINEGERRILLAIEESASKQEYSAIKKYLEDLAVVIGNNQKALEKAEKTNKWSIPTAVISIVLTLVFGIYGIFVSSLSNKDMDRMTEKITKQVTHTVDSINKQQKVCFPESDSLRTKKSE